MKAPPGKKLNKLEVYKAGDGMRVWAQFKGRRFTYRWLFKSRRQALEFAQSLIQAHLEAP